MAILNPYLWALGRLLQNGNITGLARLQAEAAKAHVKTAEGLSVLLFALGFSNQGVSEVLSMIAHRMAEEETR